MNENLRVNEKDTTEEVITKLSEGNIGAVSVCRKLVQTKPSTNGLVALLSLDYHGIYGSRIWKLYDHVCKKDITTTITVLRSCQMGIISEDDLNHAINNRSDGIDPDKICAQVKERLSKPGQQHE